MAAMDVKVDLYSTKSDVKTVSRDYGSPSMGNVSCSIYGPIDVVNPVFLLNYNKQVFQANALKCDTFGRYYFITSRELVDGGKMRVHCHVDVLKTYGSDILNSKALVYKTKGGSTTGKFLADGNIPVDSRSYIRNILFEQAEGFSFGDAGGYVLTVIGGTA